ncbi:MAG TPA: hypothetical protein DF383_09830 [Deltaproteobacteria bacterium]|nr:hypothetical protein [Deltaproteobacteria bacterium]
MFALLKDMFHRGHPADVAWFLVGGWLLALFLAIMIHQLVKNRRRKVDPADKQSRSGKIV